MTRVMPHRLDPTTSESLLAGTLHPEDAPPGYARLATLLGEAAHARAVRDRLATPAADPGTLGTVAAMREALATPRPQVAEPESPGRSVGRGLRLPARRGGRVAKVPAALAGVGLLVMGTAAAAAVVAATSPAGQPVAASHAGSGRSAGRRESPGKGLTGREASDGTHPGRDANPGTGSHQSGGSTAAGTHTAGSNVHATFGLCTAEAAGAGTHRSPHAPALPSAATCMATRHPGNGYGKPSWSLPPGGAAYLPPSTAPGTHPGDPGGATGRTPDGAATPASARPSAQAPAGTTRS